MCKLIHVSLLLVAVLVALCSEGLACSCGGEPYRPGVPLEQIRKEKREYFLYEFKGAAFIGKIVKRQRVQVNWVATSEKGDPVPVEYDKYTILISDYWFGVNSKKMVVFGQPYEVSKGRYNRIDTCGLTLRTGRTYFFTPRLYKDNLEIGQCDFAEGGSDPNEGPATEFRKIMGEPKRF